MKREPYLPHAIATRRSPRRFAGGLYRRQEQADERGDDRDHDEQLHEREGDSRRTVNGSRCTWNGLHKAASQGGANEP